jgi:glycine dehydrogenase subunit 2
MVRAFHRDQGEKKRTEVIIPDSAHGTNPASASMAGYRVLTLPSGPDGLVDVAGLKARLSERTACFMLTNPNTLGLFERHVLKIAEAVHDAGGLLYMDGANLNALLGVARPGDMGFDLCHFNLHKTFSTPHGGGGPGSGAVGCKDELSAYLPAPRIVRTEKNGQPRYKVGKAPKSIGRLHQFFGNFGMFVRAYTYILSQGHQGLRDIGETAILNANYLMAQLKEQYELPHAGPCQHEFVLSANRQKKATGVQAASRLWYSRADHLFPAGRARGPHDRAHRIGDGGNARSLRIGHAPDRGRGGERTRNGQACAAHHTGVARRRGPSRPRTGRHVAGLKA